MNPRHRARRLALQGLCCLDVQGPQAMELVEHFIRDSRESDDVLAHALRLLRDVWAGRADCDQLLARHARHWELPRLALVDRNILRLGAWELLAETASAKVILSEALRLAREFSMAESSRFINGVLDAVAREILQDTHKPARGAEDAEELPH